MPRQQNRCTPIESKWIIAPTTLAHRFFDLGRDVVAVISDVVFSGADTGSLTRAQVNSADTSSLRLRIENVRIRWIDLHVKAVTTANTNPVVGIDCATAG